MLGLTGRFADGWYPTQKMTPDEYRAKLGVIRDAAIAAGRPLDRFEPAVQIPVALGAGRRAVLDTLVKVKPAAIARRGGPGDLVRQTQLIWRLKKLQTNGAAA